MAEPKTHEERIRYLCYLITSVFNSRKLTDREKYTVINRWAIQLQNEAEDKIARL